MSADAGTRYTEPSAILWELERARMCGYSLTVERSDGISYPNVYVHRIADDTDCVHLGSRTTVDTITPIDCITAVVR